MSGILRLESLTKGNTLRQGDLTLLKYRLFDADGDKLDISGKSATVRLMKNDFTFIAYEKEGLTVAPNDTISFSVNKILPSGLYHLEVIVDDNYIFPSRDDEGKFNVDKSSLGADVTIVEATGVEAVAKKATGMMKQDEEFIDDLIENVISDTNVGNIEEYYNQFNEATTEFESLKTQALNSVTKSDKAIADSASAKSIAQGIDAKATNALSLSESADTLSKSVQEQFNQVVIDGDSSVEAAQARVDASGQTNATLKERLDKEHNEVIEQLGQTHKVINVKALGAVGDGITDDTLAFQKAMDIAKSQYGGDISNDAGYMGWFMPVIKVPRGMYKVGLVESHSRFSLEGDGMSVLISKDGSPDNFIGSFIDNPVSNMTIKNISFLFFDTVFRTPTNNLDFSFVTFENCNVSKLNTLIDMGSYATSRSTSFKMERCNVSYGVKTLVKIFSDKSHFSNNWFNHSMDSHFMELDTYATFESNVWVPTGSGSNKAYINFTGTDSVRSLHFKEDRFGGEGGSCPIVIVGEVNKKGTSEQYRNQGISFDNCHMASRSTYNPDGLSVGARSPVILRETSGKLKTINYISFVNSAFLPDLEQGIVQTYNVLDVENILPDNFVIDFDYPSTVSAGKGVNKLSSDDLVNYVNHSFLIKNVRDVRKSGKLLVSDTNELGIKKASFKINLNHAGNYLPSYTWLLVTIGQGDSKYNAYAYSYQSVYLLTVNGENSTRTEAEIKYTKLHSTGGGAALGSNADIVSAHFGTEDTGSPTIALRVDNIYKDISIVFGERVRKGSAYLIPLYDNTVSL